MKKKNKNSLFLCNLYIKSSLKKTLINLTKKNGEVLKQWSTEIYKKNKYNKSYTYNIYLLTLKIIDYLKKNKIKKINIILNKNYIGRTNIIKNFNKNGIKFFFIFNKTPILFNGCKGKKKKRY